MTVSTRITGLLIDWSKGDEAAFAELHPLIEAELRKMARRYMRQLRPGNTLQTTALINEAYLRLVEQKKVDWQNRSHFFGIAAFMMRRILLNHIRDQKRLKRGGGAHHVSLSDVCVISKVQSDEIVALNDALERLEKLDSRKAKVVELRYFGGLSVDETAEFLKVGRATIFRDWKFAKAWLAREVRP
jgi:RNA polymerase sigma-70 factor (ECF subfamily)